MSLPSLPTSPIALPFPHTQTYTFMSTLCFNSSLCTTFTSLSLLFIYLSIGPTLSRAFSSLLSEVFTYFWHFLLLYPFLILKFHIIFKHFLLPDFILLLQRHSYFLHSHLPIIFFPLVSCNSSSSLFLPSNTKFSSPSKFRSHWTSLSVCRTIFIFYILWIAHCTLCEINFSLIFATSFQTNPKAPPFCFSIHQLVMRHKQTTMVTSSILILFHRSKQPHLMVLLDSSLSRK